MCGIVGVIGDPDDGKTKTVFEQLLVIDVLRGPDSTGVAAIHPKKGVTVIKDVLLPPHLMGDKKYLKAVSAKAKENIAYIGHNRLATVGFVNRRNAHPFTHSHITMVHNGTLNKHVEAGQGKTFGTDSESIAYSLAKRGITETWMDVDGAAALLWWDARLKTYNFITNSRRPLAFAYTEGKRQLILASEVAMVRWIAARNRIKLDKDNVYCPGASYHFAVQYDAEAKEVSAEAKELKNYRPFYRAAKRAEDNTISSTTNFSNNHSGNSTGRKDIDGDQLPLLGKPKGNDNKKPLNLVNVDDKDDHHRNMMGLSEDEFHRIYANCAFCGHPLQNEYGLATIIDKNSAACEACSEVGQLDKLNLEHLMKGL